MLKHPRVLVLTEDERQAKDLSQLLTTHVTLTRVNGVPELQALHTSEFDALLCDWSLYGCTWRNVLKDIQNHDPALLLIVLSRTGGEKEWVEVIEAGGFDLLRAPHWEASVLAAVEHAIASREARGWQPAGLPKNAFRGNGCQLGKF